VAVLFQAAHTRFFEKSSDIFFKKTSPGSKTIRKTAIAVKQTKQQSKQHCCLMKLFDLICLLYVTIWPAYAQWQTVWLDEFTDGVVNSNYVR
jgi:hypothetical protein